MCVGISYYIVSSNKWSKISYILMKQYFMCQYIYMYMYHYNRVSSYGVEKIISAGGQKHSFVEAVLRVFITIEYLAMVLKKSVSAGKIYHSFEEEVLFQ